MTALGRRIMRVFWAGYTPRLTRDEQVRGLIVAGLTVASVIGVASILAHAPLPPAGPAIAAERTR
jgi:hypothetical protein